MELSVGMPVCTTSLAAKSCGVQDHDESRELEGNPTRTIGIKAMKTTDHEEKWRWLLVDSLAHGRKFWPVHLKLSTPDSDGQLMLEIEEAKASKDLLRLKQVANQLRDRLSKAFSSFSDEEAKRTLRTPRFDISSAVFLKNDIPYEQWDEYVRSLPALCIPFSEFWMIWGWRSEDGGKDTDFASRLWRNPKEDGSSVIGIETYVDLPSTGNLTEQEEIIMRIDGGIGLG